MKTKLLWISLLLAVALLFSACSADQSDTDSTSESNTTEAGTDTSGTPTGTVDAPESTTSPSTPPQSTEEPSTPETPSEKKLILGKWHCEDAYTVIELKEDLTFDYYNLIADDYAYASEITTGTYAVAENKISLPIEEGFTLVIVYNAGTDAFTVENMNLGFSRVNDLPAKIEAPDPQKFKGIWYNEWDQTVLHLHDNGTLDAYSIQAGYYTYSATESATYTITGSTIGILYDGAEAPWTFIYNPAKDSLSNAFGELYVRMDSLPEKHPVVPFPNYAELDCSSVISLGTYKGKDLTTNAKIYAALDIFDTFYTQNKNKTPVAITEDRAAIYGDCVLIDYTGYLNGTAFANGSAKNQTIQVIEESGYISGFAEGIIGHKIGETFDVPVTFPENYGNQEMAGKSVVFTMTLHTIYDLSIPDEEIKAFTNGQYTTYDQLAKDYLDTYRNQEIWNILQAEATYTEIPTEYYNYFYQYYRDLYHSYAFSYGMDYEKYIARYGLTDETILEKSKLLALPYMISQIIFKAENLEWNEEMYNSLFDQYVKDAMEYFKITEEEAKEFVLTEEANNLKSTVTTEIVTAWLLEHNN